VAKAYKELFAGYEQDAEEELGRTFEEVAGYDDIVLVKDIPFFALRAPHGADHRQGACRLSA
jgi:GTP cyclohydrolase I